MPLTERQVTAVNEVAAHQLRERRAISGARLRSTLDSGGDAGDFRFVGELVPGHLRLLGEHPSDSYELSLDGWLASQHRDRASAVAEKLVSYLKGRFQSDPDFRDYTWVDLAQDGVFPDEDASLVKALVPLLEFESGGSSGPEPTSWKWNRPRHIEELARSSGIESYLKSVRARLAREARERESYRTPRITQAQRRGMLSEMVESYQNILVALATGGGDAASAADYIRLRSALLAESSVADKLPRLVRTCRDSNQFWQFIEHKFPSYAERREYLWGEFRPVLESLDQPTSPIDRVADVALSEISAESVRGAWAKALERRTSDPEGAITAARTLLESVCKVVLDEAGVAYEEGADHPRLYRLAAENLHLAPSQHSEQVFKQILGGCTTVVEGLGALRNRLSDAHGKGARPVKPSQRHAALAVNLAGTMATYLVETHEARRTESN